MDLSVIIPVWNEEENIQPLYKKLTSVLAKTKKKYEILFVDDGSRDKTPDALFKINKKDKHVRVIQFRAHLGKSDALSTGFQKAKGKLIITMDGDLQDDPSEIPNFIKKQKEGYDLVVGWKHKRNDPITKLIPSKFFNKLTSWITGAKVHDSNCCYKIFTKDVMEDLKIYGELHRYIPALAQWNGYKITEIKVKHNPRLYGNSKYGVSRLIKGFMDLITIKFLNTYGKRPMHLFGTLGAIFLLIGFIINLYLVYVWVFLSELIGNRPLLTLGVLLMVIGAQFMSIGLLGEMIVDKESETKKRIRKQV